MTWSVEDFISAVKYGKAKNGNALRYPMLPRTVLDSAEIKAIYEYLKTVPQIKNAVDRNVQKPWYQLLLYMTLKTIYICGTFLKIVGHVGVRRFQSVWHLEN